MKRLVGYIVVICVCIWGLFSCTRSARLIPKSDLAEIYAELFVVDQWIPTRGLQRAADTSMVYAPILEKYGYTTEDFSYSVQKYMRDPDRFARIFAHSTRILKSRVEYLQVEQKKQHRLDSLKRLHEQLSLINKVPLYRNMLNPPYGHIIKMEADSCGMLIPSLTADTLYMGPKMIVSSDTLSVASDSLSVAKMDSTVVEKVSVLPDVKVKSDRAVLDNPLVVTKAVKEEEVVALEDIEEPESK